MIERMDDMPEGVIGMRASGRLTREDYRTVLEPGLQEAVDTGEARVVFVIPDFDGLEPRAWLDDLKTGLGAEISHRKEWKRLAVVSGVDWITKTTQMFAWAMPGELETFEMDQLEEAKTWAAGRGQR